MAVEGARASWCHSAANQYISQEGSKGESSLHGAHFNAMPAAESISMTNVKKEHGLAFFHIRNLQTGDNLPWQFGPSAHPDYDSQYITLEEATLPRFSKIAGSHPLPGVHPKKNYYDGSTDIQLEWQWLIDQEHASLKGSPVSVTNMEDKYEIAEELSEDIIHDALEDFPKDVGEFQEPEITMKSSKGFSKANSPTSQVGSKEEHLSFFGTSDHHRRLGNLSKELAASNVGHKESASWRTADSRELSALVSQKTLEHLENCDLPPQSSLTYKEPLASCDLTPSKICPFDISCSVDKMLLASLLHGSEPTCLDNRSLPLSPLILGMSNLTPSHKHPPRWSEPLTIPMMNTLSFSHQQNKFFSPNDQNANWNGGDIHISNGGNASSGCRGSDTLGEALCHSQTRAREAEETASQAIEQKKQVLPLFFRETSLALTYKHWVRLLEIENMGLKMQARDQRLLWMQHTYLNPSVAFEQLSNNRWKDIGRKLAQKQMHHHFSSLWQGKGHCQEGAAEGPNILVGYTVGLAFALGLSLASAGLMIGWSMGWIFLAY